MATWDNTLGITLPALLRFLPPSKHLTLRRLNRRTQTAVDVVTCHSARKLLGIPRPANVQVLHESKQRIDRFFVQLCWALLMWVTRLHAIYRHVFWAWDAAARRLHTWTAVTSEIRQFRRHVFSGLSKFKHFLRDTGLCPRHVLKQLHLPSSFMPLDSMLQQLQLSASSTIVPAVFTPVWVQLQALQHYIGEGLGFTTMYWLLPVHDSVAPAHNRSPQWRHSQVLAALRVYLHIGDGHHAATWRITPMLPNRPHLRQLLIQQHFLHSGVYRMEAQHWNNTWNIVARLQWWLPPHPKCSAAMTHHALLRLDWLLPSPQLLKKAQGDFRHAMREYAQLHTQWQRNSYEITCHRALERLQRMQVQQEFVAAHQEEWKVDIPGHSLLELQGSM